MIENLVENQVSRSRPLTIRGNEEADAENRHCDGKVMYLKNLNIEGGSYVYVMSRFDRFQG